MTHSLDECDDILALIASQYSPDQILDILGIESEELVILIGEKILDNLDEFRDLEYIHE